ncbi:hypothetical protein R6Q57_001104 [Mikania cordata]
MFTYCSAAVPEVAFYLLGQRHEMLLVKFAVVSGLYYEPETPTPLYEAEITELDDATLRIWWNQIAEDAFVGTKANPAGEPCRRTLHQSAPACTEPLNTDNEPVVVSRP